MDAQEDPGGQSEMAPDDPGDFSDDEGNDDLDHIEPEPDTKPVLSLEEAISRIPEPLRREMKELLRAEFREVRPL